MEVYPLAPFLVSLAADGICVTLRDYDRISLALRAGGPWTVKQLRGVLLALLVRDPEQEDAFLQRFDSFFKTDLATESGPSDDQLYRVLEDLQGLGRHRASSEKQRPLPRPVLIKPGFIHYQKRIIWIILLGFLIFLQPPFSITPVKIEDPVFKNSPGTLNVPEEAPPLPTPLGRLRFAYYFVPIILLAGAFFGYYIWQRRKISPYRQPRWNKDAPRHFRLGTIGGLPSKHLEPLSLDYVASLMGYFQTPEPSRALDLRRSVEHSARNGGMPALEYCKRKRLRTVVILEDTLAEPLAWNTTAKELAEGLDQRGIPVIHGKLHGSLTNFYTSDGSTHWLEDMEDYRYGCLLLIFSDGKNFRHHEADFILESLARWPMIAWMELRERRFWDESSAWFAQYGIPIYPASAKGVTEAIGRFMTEHARQEDYSYDAINWRGVPAFAGKNLYAHVEYLLGDSLPWAQACSMVQPISIGLAGALRQEFYSSLPPERIGRLFLLPGVNQSISGLRFSLPVLSILRHGFVSRADEQKQERILSFLIARIKEAEPEQVDGLAHLEWEYALERVRLELEPEKALNRISQLSFSPLGDFIRIDLENVALPGHAPFRNTPTGPALIPLRRLPESNASRQQLARIAENIVADKYTIAASLKDLYLLASTATAPAWQRTKKMAAPVMSWSKKMISPIARRFERVAEAIAAGARSAMTIESKNFLSQPIVGLVAGLIIIQVIWNFIVYENTFITNSPPTVHIEYQGTAFNPGDQVFLAAKASDLNGDELQYEWQSSTGNLLANGATAYLDTSSLATRTTPVEVEVRVTVKDGRGGIVSEETKISVVPPEISPPVIESLFVSKLEVRAGDEVLLSARSKGTGGGPLTYSWSSTAGNIIGSGNTVTLNTDGVDSTETVRVEATVKVSDAVGNSSTKSLMITVFPPNRPSVQAYLARAKKLAAQRKYDEAISVADQGLSVYPGSQALLEMRQRLIKAKQILSQP